MAELNEGDISEQLKKLALEEKVIRCKSAAPGGGRGGVRSEYQSHFNPMEKGTRVQVWQEGFQYRNIRKKSGFNHTKLEWKIPTTDRSETNREKRGSLEVNGTAVNGGVNEAFETLRLPPTKLHKKRLKLLKLYEKQLKKQEALLLKQKQQQEPAVEETAQENGSSPKKRPMTSYDRNRIYNSRSHIPSLMRQSLLPTASSSNSSRRSSVTKLQPEQINKSISHQNPSSSPKKEDHKNSIEDHSKVDHHDDEYPPRPQPSPLKTTRSQATIVDEKDLGLSVENSVMGSPCKLPHYRNTLKICEYQSPEKKAKILAKKKEKFLRERKDREKLLGEKDRQKWNY